MSTMKTFAVLSTILIGTPMIAAHMEAPSHPVAAAAASVAAPIFDQSMACARPDIMIINQLAGSLPDDINHPMARFHQSESPQCKAEKVKFLATWMVWYNQASPADREAEEDRASRAKGGGCGSAWPIGCSDGF